jgi:hypothetical protein
MEFERESTGSHSVENLFSKKSCTYSKADYGTNEWINENLLENLIFKTSRSTQSTVKSYGGKCLLKSLDRCWFMLLFRLVGIPGYFVIFCVIPVTFTVDYWIIWNSVLADFIIVESFCEIQYYVLNEITLRPLREIAEGRIHCEISCPLAQVSRNEGIWEIKCKAVYINLSNGRS